MKTKLKNVFLMGLSLVLVAALAIGGTVAFLQDDDGDVNVMTLGNVSIRQDEYQRVEENGVFTAELEAFQQGKLMMPYVSRTNTPENITIGGFTAVFNDQYANYVDKIVAVTNTGKTDAYVRTLIALPTGDVEKTGSASDNWLHWNTWGKNPVTGAYDMDATWDSFYDNPDLKQNAVIKINGMEYRVWEFVHTAKLAAGATACPTLTGVYLDKRVNNDDTGYYMDLNNNNKCDADEKRINIPVGEPLNVYVLSQAVQTDGFADAFAALDTAFGDVTATNAAEWFGGMSVPTVVATADELKEAIANGGNVMLTDNIELTTTLMPTKDVVIDLNGKTIKTTSSSSLFQSQSNAAPSMIITSSTAGAVIDATNSTFNNGVVHCYGKTEIRNVTINAGSNKVVQVQGNGSVEIYDTVINADSGNPFNVAGDFTLGKGTVVNVTNLNSSLINNNGAHAIVIDGAKINVGTFKVNATPMIALNQASTLVLNNTDIVVDNFYISTFGNYFISKVDGVTIDGCTFDVTGSDGADYTFVAKDGKYRLVQK